MEPALKRDKPLSKIKCITDVEQEHAQLKRELA
jgi:hypothetical protein